MIWALGALALSVGISGTLAHLVMRSIFRPIEGEVRR